MNRSLAVTIASRVYAPEGSAAAYRLAALAQALRDAGHTTTVLTTRAPGGPKSSREVRRWPVLRDRSGSVRGYLQYASFDVPLFFRLVFGPRADVIVVEPPPTTGFVTRIAAAIRRTPYVYFSADVLSAAVAGVGVHPAVARIVRFLESFALRGASGVLTISESVRDKVIALGAREELVLMIGTGIDTAQFSAEGPIAESDPPYLIYAGTMSEVHGAGVFIDAFALIAEEFPTARLVFFASGVDVEGARRSAEAFGGRVEINGLVDSATLAARFRGARASLASVRPGKGYDFAYATKALASLGCGTPVVYAGVGPLATLVTEERLGWAAGWNEEDVASAMRAALTSTHSNPDPRLAAWVDNHYSLRMVAARGAAAVAASARN